MEAGFEWGGLGGMVSVEGDVGEEGALGERGEVEEEVLLLELVEGEDEVALALVDGGVFCVDGFAYGIVLHRWILSLQLLRITHLAQGHHQPHHNHQMKRYYGLLFNCHLKTIL